MENEENVPAFHAGICMAGAISAGAYTAGVIDYLLEALEHWAHAKRLQEEGKLSGIPQHNFLIEVLGGASAGGMTAAITTAAMQKKFDPVMQAEAGNNAVTTQNPLYNSWVNLTEEDGKDMMDIMLCTDDINKDTEHNKFKEVRAGLNSSFIKEVANNLLNIRVDEKHERPYVADDMDVFTTVTNLRGFNYEVLFSTSAGVRKHRMKMHRDYAFFKLSEKLYGNDGRIPVNFNKPDGLNIEILKQAAMATGAFPVGLESRDITRESKYIKENKYLNLQLSAGGESSHVYYNFLPEGDFLSLNVDGGVINNEPYEITQQLLNDRRTGSNPETPYELKTSARDFDSLVLMVDPFPDDEDEIANFVPKKAWRHIMPSILSAMRQQLMLKEEQIKRAYLSNDYTRFLIMPVRTKNEEHQLSAIACGSLGGFGGFFSKKFREHDFFLGRRNCQRFLQLHFNAPEDAGNAILKFGYENAPAFKKTFKNEQTGADAIYLPLIPDMRVVFDAGSSTYKTVAPPVEKEYEYPSIKLSYILKLKPKIEERIKCILNNVMNVEKLEKQNDREMALSPILKRLRKRSFFGKILDGFKGLALKGYIGLGKLGGKGALAEMCIDAIITDMEKKGLIEDDLK